MMLIWFILGTGVITLSAVMFVAVVYLTVTGWLYRNTWGDDDKRD